MIMTSNGVGSPAQVTRSSLDGTAAATRLSQLAAARGSRAQAQRVKLDKALGVGLVVGALVLFKVVDTLIKERVIGLEPRNADTPLLKIETHRDV